MHAQCSFNDTATTEIYTLSLHDALPIYQHVIHDDVMVWVRGDVSPWRIDRKSTRLNSSHLGISYAVFCLEKKKQQLSTKCEGPLCETHSTSQSPVSHA